MIIKKKIHRAPKKGSFLRSLLTCFLAERLSSWGGVPPPPLSNGSRFTQSQNGSGLARRGRPLSLPSLTAPTPLSGSSHTHLLVLLKPTCRTLLVGTCTFRLSICWFSKLHSPSSWAWLRSLSRRPLPDHLAPLPYFLHCAYTSWDA